MRAMVGMPYPQHLVQPCIRSFLLSFQCSMFSIPLLAALFLTFSLIERKKSTVCVERLLPSSNILPNNEESMLHGKPIWLAIAMLSLVYFHPTGPTNGCIYISLMASDSCMIFWGCVSGHVFRLYWWGLLSFTR